MEIIKAATEWARAEITSSFFYMFFGVAYIIGSFALWKSGNTPMTKALIVPLLVAGGLLLSAGIGFYLSNKSRLTTFETDYLANPSTFINSEMTRTAGTIKSYENVALKVFPAIILVAALVYFFVSNHTVKAISIGIIAFLLVLVLLDSQALKRVRVYHDHLKLEQRI